MWNCSFGPPFLNGFGGLLITSMMVVTIVYIMILIVRSFFGKDTAVRDVSDSLEIVKRKFAMGEISEEEFQKMREILTR